MRGVRLAPLIVILIAIQGCADPPRDAVTLLTMKPDDVKVWNEALDLFRASHPDVPIRVEIAPRSSTQYHDLLTQRLKNRDDSIDVFLVDVTWPPELASAGWLRPLDDLFSAGERAEFLEGPIEANTFAGRIWAVPSRVDAGMLYYRRDLLERHGLAVPRTWPELVAHARRIVDGEGAQSGLAGYSAQFKQYEGLVCNMLEFIGSNGGHLVDPAGGDQAVGIAAPPAVAATQFVRDQLVGAIAPRGTLAYEESESLALFTEGAAVFHRNWPYAWAIANDPAQSRVAGRVGVTWLPSFPGHQSVSALGGYQYGISAYSRRVREAWTFVAFMTGPAMQKHFAVRLGHAPARRALYDDPDVLRANPQLADQRPAFFNARPRPASPLYPMLSNVLQRYLSRAIGGSERDLGDLPIRARRELEDILDLVPVSRRPGVAR